MYSILMGTAKTRVNVKMSIRKGVIKAFARSSSNQHRKSTTRTKDVRDSRRRAHSAQRKAERKAGASTEPFNPAANAARDPKGLLEVRKETSYDMKGTQGGSGKLRDLSVDDRKKRVQEAKSIIHTDAQLTANAAKAAGKGGDGSQREARSEKPEGGSRGRSTSRGRRKKKKEGE